VGGHLIFGRDGNLLAQPFDIGRFEFTGEATRVAEQLGLSYGDLSNYAFSSSGGGALAYWNGSAIPVTQLTLFDRAGKFNARWLAYASDESGRSEVYIDSFPQIGDKVRVSTTGGVWPRWRKDGNELYYIAPDRKLMAVSITRGSSGLRGSSPRPLFETPMVSTQSTSSRPQYAVLANGERFLFNALVSDPNPQGITVMLNWSRKRMP